MAEAKVETTQVATAPAVGGTRYAGFLRRLVAAIVDGTIVSVISQVIFTPISLMFGLGAAPVLSGLTASGDETVAAGFVAAMMGLAGVSFIISFIIQALYFGGFLVYKQGQTLGKMFLGIRVVSIDGKPITWGKALLREILGKMISVLVLGLGYLWVIWDGKKQAWHDKIAGTYVVYK